MLAIPLVFDFRDEVVIPCVNFETGESQNQFFETERASSFDKVAVVVCQFRGKIVPRRSPKINFSRQYSWKIL